MNALVNGGAGFIGSRPSRYAAGSMVPLRGPGWLLLQGLRPRTPVQAGESDADRRLP